MKTAEELIEEKLSQMDGGYIEFDGHNCRDAWDEGANCEGWDGRDRRCQCGNRRVSWVLSDDGTYVYGEAY